MAKQILWAGRTLNGTDRFGKWVATELEGWWDSPDTKGEDADRPNADGEYDLPIHNAARLVTIGGNLHAVPGQMFEAGDFITGPMLGRLQVAGFGSTKWADAKRTTGVRFTPITEELAQWQVRLKMPNPRKYGNTNSFTFASIGDLYQWGNYPASPVFTVSGSAPLGYTINGENGEEYKVTTPLVTGSPHVINFADARLRIGGTLTSNGNGAADVWDTAAGSLTRYIFTSAGSVSVTATVTDTFI